MTKDMFSWQLKVDAGAQLANMLLNNYKELINE